MKNSIKAEIAREARRSYPIGWKLAGVTPGDIIFVGHHREVLRPVQVEKVGKVHVLAGGVKYSAQTGIRAGKYSSHSGYGYTRAHPYSDALNDAWDVHNLKAKFEQELAIFRAKPELQTKERLLAILRAMNPEAWK